MKLLGWRAAFAVPAAISVVCGVLFALLVPREEVAPAKRAKKQVDLPADVMVRVFLVMTLAAISGSLIFNFTTNGNGRLIAERLAGIVDDPATLDILLAAVYTVASLAQIVVGKLIDRFPLKRIYLPTVAAQVPLFLLAAYSSGWMLYAAAALFMVFVFGAIPFIDAMIVQYVDDRMRSRVSGTRLAVSFGVSAVAVYVLGPVVKAAGFTTLLLLMAGISARRALFVSFLPGEEPRRSDRPSVVVTAYVALGVAILGSLVIAVYRSGLLLAVGSSEKAQTRSRSGRSRLSRPTMDPPRDGVCRRGAGCGGARDDC